MMRKNHHRNELSRHQGEERQASWCDMDAAVSSASFSSVDDAPSGNEPHRGVLTRRHEQDPDYIVDEDSRDSHNSTAIAAPKANEDEDETNDKTSYQESQPGKQYRRRAVVIYTVSLTLLYADMQLLAPNLTAIGNEFGFDDEERDRRIGGHIAVAFFLVGAPVSFLVGWLADSHKRAPLFSLTVFLGELACFATFFTTTYQGLFVCRILTGIAVGGSLPIMYSVLGDLFKAGHRAAVSALISTGTGVGIAIGHALAGFLGDKTRFGWRLPFLVVSMPSFAIALLVLTIPEPERGGKEAARLEMEMERRRLARLDPTLPEEYDGLSKEHTPAQAITEDQGKDENNENCAFEAEKTSAHPCDDYVDSTPRVSPRKNNETMVSWKTTWEMLKTPSVILIMIQGAPGALPFGMASVYLNDYLSEDRGMTKEQATGVLMQFGAGNAIGVVLGGIFGHMSYRCDVRYPPVIMGLALIFSIVPMWFVIEFDKSTTFAITGLVAALAGVLAVMPIPIERAILANVCLPETRGRANSFLGILDDLGKGLGPVFVSLLISNFGRETAFKVSLLGWLIGGCVSFFLYCTVRHDEDRVQESVREFLEAGAARGDEEISSHLSVEDNEQVAE